MHRQPVRLLLPRCINVLKHLTSINASACWHNCRYLLGKCEFPMILYPFSTVSPSSKSGLSTRNPVDFICYHDSSLPLSLSHRFLRSSLEDRFSIVLWAREISVKFLSSISFFIYLLFLKQNGDGSKFHDWYCSTYRESQIEAISAQLYLFLTRHLANGGKRHNSARIQQAIIR